MNPVVHLVPGIRAFRLFLPAKEFETSLRFYEAIGFEAHRLGDTLAELSLGTHAFLLQGHYVKGGEMHFRGPKEFERSYTLSVDAGQRMTDTICRLTLEFVSAASS